MSEPKTYENQAPSGFQDWLKPTGVKAGIEDILPTGTTHWDNPWTREVVEEFNRRAVSDILRGQISFTEGNNE